MKFRYGCTRGVLVIGKWAIKFPRWYRGIRANRNEHNWWMWFGDKRMCPVLWMAPFGLLLIMPRVKHLSCSEAWRITATGLFSGLPGDCGNPENMGILNGHPVTFDYGALGYPPTKI